MPKFSVEIPHTLSAEEAKSRLERFAQMLADQHGERVSELDQTWNGNSLSFGFKTFGIKVSGAIAAEDHRLVVSGDLPFSAMIFKGKIESEIRHQLERLTRK